MKSTLPSPSRLSGGLPSLRRPGPAEVPLADARGGVAVPAEQRGDGEPVGLDERSAPRRQHAGLQPRAEAVAAREQAVARRRADRVGRVGVGEADALGGQAVEVRRGDLRLPRCSSRRRRSPGRRRGCRRCWVWPAAHRRQRVRRAAQASRVMKTESVRFMVLNGCFARSEKGRFRAS